MSKVATKSNITLKGSVEIVTEFFGTPPAPPGQDGVRPVSRFRAPPTLGAVPFRRLQHQLDLVPTRYLPSGDLPAREQIRVDHACHDGRRAQRLPRERAHAAFPCVLPPPFLRGPLGASHPRPQCCLHAARPEGTRLAVRPQSGSPRGRCRSWSWWSRGSRHRRRSSAGSSTFTRTNRSVPRARSRSLRRRSRRRSRRSSGRSRPLSPSCPCSTSPAPSTSSSTPTTTSTCRRWTASPAEGPARFACRLPRAPPPRRTAPRRRGRRATRNTSPTRTR